MCLAQQEEADGEDEGGVEEVDGEGQEVKEKTKPPESKLDKRLQVSDIIFGCFYITFHFTRIFFSKRCNTKSVNTHVHVRESHPRQLRKSDCFGCVVLLCFVFCMALLASFLLPSASLINMYNCTCMYTRYICTCMCTRHLCACTCTCSTSGHGLQNPVIRVM